MTVTTGTPQKTVLRTTESLRNPVCPRLSFREAGRGSFTKVAITEWAQRRLAPDAEIYSDGLGGFRAVVDCNHAHTVIDAGGGRAATEVAGARWVNIVLSNVKRALDGTYHSFHFFKYAQRYLGEAAWRFNRRFRLDAMVPRLLVASARCRAWTEFKLRNVPVFLAETQR